MKKQNVGLFISLSVLVLAVITMVGLVVGVRGAFDNLEVALKKSEASAILSGAEMQDDTVISVPIIYYDQKMDDCVNLYDAKTMWAVRERQFEWDSCGYYVSKVETGLVWDELDEQFLPVAIGGELLPNSGLGGESFGRWFNQVDGKSKSFASFMNLTYNEKQGSIGYRNEEFYPLDEIEQAADESVNQDGHNHLFTFNLGVPFRVLADGREEFEIEADDDTWVFIDDALVLDMGGIHDVAIGRLWINEAGEIYSAVENIDFAYSGVKLKVGDEAVIRIFHADRNSKNSMLGIRMTNMVPTIVDTKLAQKEKEVEVAYDPANPSYIAPLGETLVTAPDNRRSLVNELMVQVVTLGGLGALAIVTISAVYRYLHRDHSQEE